MDWNQARPVISLLSDKYKKEKEGHFRYRKLVVFDIAEG